MACKGSDSRLSRPASGGLMMPRDPIARPDKELVNQMIKHPLAWIPVAMSLAILAMVLTTLGLSGAVRQEDEGTQAHLSALAGPRSSASDGVRGCMGASETEAGTRRSGYSDPWRTCGLRSGFLFQVVAWNSARAVIGSSHRPWSSSLHRPCRARPADRYLTRRTRALEASATGRTEPAGTRWVHAEPAGRRLQRAPAVTMGQKDRRSHSQRGRDQAAPQEAGQSSSLPPLPRALWAPAHEQPVTEEAAASGLLVLSGAEQPGDLLQGASAAC